MKMVEMDPKTNPHREMWERFRPVSLVDGTEPLCGESMTEEGHTVFLIIGREAAVVYIEGIDSHGGIVQRAYTLPLDSDWLPISREGAERYADSFAFPVLGLTDIARQLRFLGYTQVD